MPWIATVHTGTAEEPESYVFLHDEALAQDGYRRVSDEAEVNMGEPFDSAGRRKVGVVSEVVPI